MVGATDQEPASKPPFLGSTPGITMTCSYQVAQSPTAESELAFPEGSEPKSARPSVKGRPRIHSGGHRDSGSALQPCFGKSPA